LYFGLASSLHQSRSYICNSSIQSSNSPYYPTLQQHYWKQCLLSIKRYQSWEDHSLNWHHEILESNALVSLITAILSVHNNITESNVISYRKRYQSWEDHSLKWHHENLETNALASLIIAELSTIYFQHFTRYQTCRIDNSCKD
jgi:hypothetical protein